jgi:hypothetical protein
VKRIRRVFVQFATALSLLLFLAAAALWIRGYFVSDKLYYSRWRIEDQRAKESAYWFLSSRGQIGIAQRLQDSEYASRSSSQYQSLFEHPETAWKCERPPASIPDADVPPGLFHPLGFSYTNQPMPPQMALGGFRQWLAPLWFICLISAALPAYRLSRRYFRRYPPGHCPECGYDLRATPARCPECGAEK